MQSVESCFKKIKKDCLKFIKSQETSKEKFDYEDQEKIPRKNNMKKFLIFIAAILS